MIIGLAGKKRCGKDTVADYLVANYNYNRVGLADPIKAAVAALLGVTVEEAEAYGREKAMPWLNNATFRKLWQTLGTEWGRQLIDNDIWLKLANLTKGDNVISDIRFDNESNYIRNNNGIMIHIIRAETDTAEDCHLSECGVTEDFSVDRYVFNNSTLEDLYKQVDTIIYDLNSSVPSI